MHCFNDKLMLTLFFLNVDFKGVSIVEFPYVLHNLGFCVVVSCDCEIIIMSLHEVCHLCCHSMQLHMFDLVKPLSFQTVKAVKLCA